MTSTGKLPNDGSFESKIDKVKFMRKILPDDMKIKFSGGVRTTEQIKELSGIVDRIGTGDAYAAGLIYALQNFDDYKAMEFASAASALKHTYEGDVNFATVGEVTSILEGNTTGRLHR